MLDHPPQVLRVAMAGTLSEVTQDWVPCPGGRREGRARVTVRVSVEREAVGPLLL